MTAKRMLDRCPHILRTILILQIIDFIPGKSKWISAGHLVPNIAPLYYHHGAPRFRIPTSTICHCSLRVEFQEALRRDLQVKSYCL